MIKMITVDNHQKIRVLKLYFLIRMIFSDQDYLSSRTSTRLLSADCLMAFVEFTEREQYLTSRPNVLSELVSGNLTQGPAKRAHKKKLTKFPLTGLNADTRKVDKAW